VHRDLEIEFKELVKSIISPRLKLLGYKKSNLNFNRHLDNLIHCIKIQKSQWNHKDLISFTVNYGLFNDTIYKVSLNKQDLPKFINDNDCFAWGRTGHLIYGNDYWYELSLEKEFDLVAGQVSNDFDDKLLPLMNQFDSIESLVDLIRLNADKRPNGLIIDIDSIAIYELEFGDFNKGKEILIDLYANALIPKSVSSTTVYPDGRKEVKWSEPSVNQYFIDNLIRLADNYKIEIKK
jgi:hypothetical protein